MYIKNKDLDFLIELENKLGNTEGWSEDTFKLWSLIDRLLKEREKTNKRTLNIITEKRKTNPNYGRSKEEIQAKEKAKNRRNKKEN